MTDTGSGHGTPLGAGDAEELANGLSHGVGLLGAIAATPLLIVSAVAGGGAADIVGGAVFGASMILLYLASTTFHLARRPALKLRLQRLDHAAIFVLIAGTYTPFTLGVLGGPWGWTLFGLVWGAALLGVLTKLVAGVGHKRLSLAVYLTMGWLVLIAIRPLWVAMDPQGILWLVLGGLAYSVGAVFYSAPRLGYSHFVWHLFVLAGSTCHFFAALWYAAQVHSVGTQRRHAATFTHSSREYRCRMASWEVAAPSSPTSCSCAT